MQLIMEKLLLSCCWFPFYFMLTAWSLAISAQGAPIDFRQNHTSIRDRIFDVLFRNYKNHERPTELLGGPTNVTVYIKVLAINSVDVRNMEYSTDMLLRQQWVDPRLEWDNITEFANFTTNIVSPKLKEKVWLPDLFFRNGKQGYLHLMTQANYLMRLRPNGEVLYSQKITMRLSCQMDLATFPMDTQYCHMNIGSYGYTVDQLKFNWSPTNPMVLEDKMQISEFNTPTHTPTKDCTEGYSTATGAYTCLMATFELQRQLSSYLTTTYIPSVLIVMVSWLNFWVSIEVVPARVTLGLLTLLGILTQASTLSSSLPRVSYIKAIDIWTIACIIFIISAFIEFAVATTLLRQQKSDRWKNEVRTVVRQELARWCAACQQQQLQAINNQYTVNRGQVEFCEELELLLTQQVVASDGKYMKAERPKAVESDIDSYSRFLFPACFLLYNCFYWLYYLVLVYYLPNQQTTKT